MIEMKNRSDIEVMASILSSASRKWEYKTTIMYNACISHSQLIRYLNIVLEKGLIEYSEEYGRYKTTGKGLKFLEKYLQLLKLLPNLPDTQDFEMEKEKINQIT